MRGADNELEKALRRPAKVRRLLLDYDDLRSLPPEIGTLKQLTLLNLSANKRIKRLPDEIGDLSSLRVLYLPANGLVEVPDSIGRLGRLQILNLEQNPLRRLPATLHQCKRLTTLILHANRLDVVPDLSALKQLRHLSIGRNPLKHFPHWIARLTQLQRLSILPSGARRFEKEIFELVQKLPALEKLIAKLPKEMEMALKHDRKLTIRPVVRGWAVDW